MFINWREWIAPVFYERSSVFFYKEYFPELLDNHGAIYEFSNISNNRIATAINIER